MVMLNLADILVCGICIAVGGFHINVEIDKYLHKQGHEYLAKQTITLMVRIISC